MPASTTTSLEVLMDLVATVNAAGGIYRDRNNYPCPAGDPGWLDLGEVYLRACGVLNVKPREAGEIPGEFVALCHNLGLEPNTEPTDAEE